MSKDISKSPEMLQKEAQLKALQTQLKKRQTVLKSLKTRLSNTQENIDTTQRNIQSEVLNSMSQLDDLRLEIVQLAKKLGESKNLSEKDKVALAQIAEELTGESLFGEGFDEYKAQKEAIESGEFEFEEEFRAKMNDAYAQFKVKPEEKEQRDIRAIFIKLSKRFHPDLARTDQERTDYHSMMQQINEAYKNNDIQTLLNLEQAYLIEELDYSGKAITIDVLDEAIKRFQRDLELIEGQVERTSLELKNLRNSEMGQMLTSMNKAEREGEGISDMTAQIQEMTKELNRFRDALKDSIELDKISPSLMALVDPFAGTPLDGLGITPDMTEHEMMQKFMEGMMNGNADPNEMMQELIKQSGGMTDTFDDDDEGGSLMDLFDMDEPEYEAIENPQFPIGSYVRVKKRFSNPHNKKVQMKGWVGQIHEAYYLENGHETYSVILDSISSQQIPQETLEDIMLNDDDFRVYEFSPDLLESTEPRSTKREDDVTHKRLFHENKWAFLEDDQAERIKNVLLADIHISDIENWKNYLNKNLSFPFNVKTLGELGPIMKFKVTSFDSIHTTHGIIMAVQQGKQKGTFPLSDMAVTQKKNPNYRIVQDYLEWAEDTLYASEFF